MFSSVFTVQHAVNNLEDLNNVIFFCISFSERIIRGNNINGNSEWKVYLVCLHVCFFFVAHCSSFIFLSVDLSSHCMSNGDAKTAATMEFMMIPIAVANRRKITRDKKKSEKQKKKYLHYKNWRKNSRFKRDKILQCKIQEPNRSIVLVLVLHPQSTFSIIRFDVYFALDENNVVGSKIECIISFQCSHSLK